METNFLHLYVKHFDMLGNVICYPKVEQDCSTPLFIASAETSALIEEGGRGGGVNFHTLAFCPTNFFWNELKKQLFLKEISWAGRA